MTIASLLQALSTDMVTSADSFIIPPWAGAFGWCVQGGGHLLLSAAALPAGNCLPAIHLTDQGQVTNIRIMAHTAG